MVLSTSQISPPLTPRGPLALPVVGTAGALFHNPIEFAIRNYRRYGDVIRINFLGFHGAALHGAAANRYVLIDNVANFLVEPALERAHARWIVGEGLLFLDEPAHKQQRRLIMPSFHRKRIEDYQRVMVESTGALMARWQPGEAVDISREMHHLALIIVGRTLFNMDLSGSAHELGDAVKALVSVVSDAARIAFAQLPFDVPGIGYGATVRRALAQVDHILGDIIAQHEREESDTGDVVSTLVAARDEDGTRMTPQQIRDHLLTLFVAGHETSANALAWAFYLLAQHPAITEKLLAELDRELHGAPPTPADLERLPYLEQVVKEVLRLYPPAFQLIRTAAEPFDWKGYHFDKGNLILISPFVSHHMPDQFPAPETFRPERFDPVLGDTIPPYAYIPFSVGSRSCIGAPFATMEIKTVLAQILPHFRLALVPGQEVTATVRTTIQALHGIQMIPMPQDGHSERSPARVRGNVVGATPGPA